MNSPIVEVQRVSKQFGSTVALRNVEVHVDRGEVLGMVGENGAGKSTLMKIIAGDLEPNSGELKYAGKTAALRSIRDGRARGVQLVHQELAGARSLTVAENVYLGRYPTRPSGLIDRQKMNEAAQNILQRVGLSYVDPRCELGGLRSGEQHLVEIAKALSSDPRLLILDEPTSALTPGECERLFEIVHGLAHAGAGIIFITHRLEEALAHCDRIVVLRDGCVTAQVHAHDVSKRDLIFHMLGKSAVTEYHGGNGRPDRVSLRVEELSGEECLDPISLTAQAGEVLGLFGLLGAGRTEFLETLYGMRAARTGTVQIDGQALRLGSSTEAVRRGLFMLPESRQTQGILPSHSIGRNISLAQLRSLSRFGLIDGAAEMRGAAAMAHTLQIRMSSLAQPITVLSGGNQQKALLARAMLARPKVLLLDEPTNGIDVGAKMGIYRIIRDLAVDGTTVILASSDLPEILALADRCIVFAEGRIAADLSRSEMTESAILAHAFSVEPAHA